MKKNILYLCHRIPYPPNKGDKIRSFNEIKFLSKTYTIDLITLADDPEDLKYAENLKKYCRQVVVFPLNKISGKIKGLLSLLSGQSISQGYFYQKKIQSTFNRWTSSGHYDAIICFSSPMAEYVFRAEKRIKELAKILIMDFCDLDSDKWYQYSQKTAFPLNFIYKREATKLLRFEKKINKIFSKSVFVSQKEVDLFLEYYPEARNIEVVANGVDHVFFNPDNTELFQIFPSPMITFCGAMDYYANIDGVIWFTKKILPLIKQVFPDIIFYIVGSNPDASVTSLKKDPAVKITGFVKDTREYYKAADVCVIPLRIARGVQNKVLEAMSMGKPVVSTSHAIQGIQIHSGEYLEIEDDPVEFARKVIDLLGDTERAQNLGKAARSFVIRDYNWETNLQGLYV